MAWWGSDASGGRGLSQHVVRHQRDSPFHVLVHTLTDSAPRLHARCRGGVVLEGRGDGGRGCARVSLNVDL